MAKLVSKVYGDALFEAVLDMGSMDAAYEEVSALQSVWQEHSDLVQLLNHPQIVKEEKVSIMKSIFAGRISDGVMGLLAAIVDKGRQQSIPEIFTYFADRVKEYKRIGTVSVSSAVELSGQQKSDLKERLLATTSYVELEIAYTVDPALIGGMVIRIGDRVVDSSIKTQLYELKKSLLNLQMG